MAKKHSNVKNLFPSPELVQAVRCYKERPTVEQYVCCLTLPRSHTEEEYLLSEISLESLPLLRRDATIQDIWRALDELAALTNQVGPPNIPRAQTPIAAKTDINTSATSVFEKVFEEAISPRISAEQEAIARGFKFIPKRPWLYGKNPGDALKVFEALKDDLEFDLFGDLEKALAAQDRALRCCATARPQPVQIGANLRSKVVSDFNLLLQRFLDACEAEAGTEEGDGDIGSVSKALGAVIATFARHAMSIAMLGRILNEGFAPITSRPNESPLDDQADDMPEAELASAVERVSKRFCLSGLDEQVAAVLAATYLRLLICTASEDVKGTLSCCLAASFIFPPSLRESVLHLMEEATAAPDELELACCCHSELEEGPALSVEIAQFFEQTGLHQRPISNFALAEAMLDLFYVLDGEFPPEHVLRLFFLRLDRLIEAPTKEGWTAQLCGLEELAQFAAWFGATDERTFESSLWMLATFIREDLWLTSARRTKSAIEVTRALLEDGFNYMAGLLFSYYLVTSALEVSDRSNPVAPIGSWRDIEEIAGKLKEKWSPKILKVVSLVQLLLAPERDEFDFARAQLHCLAGEELRLDPRKEENVVSLRSSVQSNIHESRLRQVISADDWHSLPESSQKQLLALERSFDVHAGDEAIFGPAGYSWAVDYFNLVETSISSLSAILWTPQLMTHLQTASLRYGDLPKRPTVGASLRIWKEAIRSGDRLVLEKLKQAGISNPPITLIDDLIRICTFRNSATHAGDPPEQRARAAQEVRIWVLKHLALVYRHLGSRN